MYRVHCIQPRINREYIPIAHINTDLHRVPCTPTVNQLLNKRISHWKTIYHTSTQTCTGYIVPQLWINYWTFSSLIYQNNTSNCDWFYVYSPYLTFNCWSSSLLTMRLFGLIKFLLIYFGTTFSFRKCHVILQWPTFNRLITFLITYMYEYMSNHL